MATYNPFSVLDSDDEGSNARVRVKKTQDSKKKSQKTTSKKTTTSSSSFDDAGELGRPARRSERGESKKNTSSNTSTRKKRSDGGRTNNRSSDSGSGSGSGSGSNTRRRKDTPSGRDNRGKRVMDRRSGTGRSSGASKNGGGRANWGNMEDELRMMDESQHTPNEHQPTNTEGETVETQASQEQTEVEEVVVEEDPNMTVEQFKASRQRINTRQGRHVNSESLAGMSRVTNKKQVPLSEEAKMESASTSSRSERGVRGGQNAYQMFGFSKQHNSNQGGRRQNSHDQEDRRNRRRVNTQDNREFPALRA